MYYWIADDGTNRGYMESEEQPPQVPIYTPITKEEYDAAIAAIKQDDEPAIEDITE